MTAKAVLRRRQAQLDIMQAADYYFEEGGADLELRFIDAVSAAIARIGIQPGIGSPRYAAQLNFDGLRSWPVRRFPYLVFYIEREDQVDVLRALHGQRDLPEWLGEPTC